MKDRKLSQKVSQTLKEKSNKKVVRYKNYREFIDAKTGEVMTFRVIGMPKEFKDKDFVKFFTAFTTNLVLSEKIVGKSIRLLFYIVSKLLTEINHVKFYMSEKQVCKDLKISRQTFYNWKKDLITEGIISKIDTNYYVLNPNCVCVGSGQKLSDQYYEAIASNRG